MADGSQPLWVVRLGVVEYREALALQEAVRERRQRDEIPDVLLLLEHPPTYTRGRRSRDDELSFAPGWYAEQGIDLVRVQRGGFVTYHGPGQLVGYPIMRIGDVMSYVRTVEQGLLAALADAGVPARSRPDEGPAFIGAWVDDRKIASIGVHVSRHVTTHGFAVNVDNDMRPWEWVVACNLPSVRMTSIAQELGDTTLTHPPATEPLALHREPSERVQAFATQVVTRMSEAFGLQAREVSPEALGLPRTRANADRAGDANADRSGGVTSDDSASLLVEAPMSSTGPARSTARAPARHRDRAIS